MIASILSFCQDTVATGKFGGDCLGLLHITDGIHIYSSIVASMATFSTMGVSVVKCVSRC